MNAASKSVLTMGSCTLGLDEGISVGAMDGIIVGTSVGDSEGPDEGTSVGASEGIIVGTSVGD